MGIFDQFFSVYIFLILIIPFEVVIPIKRNYPISFFIKTSHLCRNCKDIELVKTQSADHVIEHAVVNISYFVSFQMKSVSVKDVDQHKFVRALAAFFKKSGKVKQPEWADLVKTAVYKELAPFDEDWFYIRMAS